MKRGWAPGNAVAEAERPRADGADPDIRFIDLEELEALLRRSPTTFSAQSSDRST